MQNFVKFKNKGMKKMAILNSPLGDFSGSLGEVTFRKRNGKTVASQKSRKRKKSDTEKVKRNHGDFCP